MKIKIDKTIKLIDFLFARYPDSPKTRIKKLLKKGAIKINNNPVTLHSYVLNSGDYVEIDIHLPKKIKTELPFPVLYEDEHVIVVDKPAGISTYSNDGSINIYQIVLQSLKDASKGEVRAHIVHRLDKEVSGVILFAKSENVMNTIKENWKQTEKHYHALVEGIPEKVEDTIQSWIIEDTNIKVRSGPEEAGGKLAITHYKVTRRLNQYTLLDVRIETGRKNQIRVHLSDIGCPIVGDRRYGASADYVRRIRLHACYLSFPHPVTGKIITVESPMPKRFLTVKAENEDYK